MLRFNYTRLTKHMCNIIYCLLLNWFEFILIKCQFNFIKWFIYKF